MSAAGLDSLSDGQRLAVRSLQAIADESRGALTVEADDMQEVHGVVYVRVWLSSSSLPHRSGNGGRGLRPWEPIDLAIPPDFPLYPPVAAAGHDDFRDLPHVALGSGFCIRVLENDWNPSAGMAGFMRQVISTYGHISLGTLAGHLLPWHRPEPRFAAGCVVVKADAPDAISAAGPDPVLGWAVGERLSEHRVDITGWLGTGESPADWQAAQAPATGPDEHGSQNAEIIFVPAVSVPWPAAFEYSSQLLPLLDKLGGVSALGLVELIGEAAVINRGLAGDTGTGGEEPVLFLLRAPADTEVTESGVPVRFAAASLPAADAEAAGVMSGDDADSSALERLEQALKAPVSWITTFDGTAATMSRRHAGRPVTKLAGARVLVLGCGALGAPIAEHCVRAGAARIHLVDEGTVSPGILVRQPYSDADIGWPKAEVLAARLDDIMWPGADITYSAEDVVTSPVLSQPSVASYDLVIDATAGRRVHTAIEIARRDSAAAWPALITVAISQEASTGIAAVTPRGATGAGVDLLRQLALASASDSGLADVREDFFPAGSRAHFQAEPGCSDATFAGSATDVSALAALLLDSALAHAGPISPGDHAADHASSRSLCVVRAGRDGSPLPARVHLAVPPDLVVRDAGTGFEVRIAGAALDQMRRCAGSASGGPAAGVLLGQLDWACKVAWVSQVREPSRAGERGGSGLTGPIGYWHAAGDDAAGGDDAAAGGRENPSSAEPMAEMVVLTLSGAPAGEAGQDWTPEISARVVVA